LVKKVYFGEIHSRIDGKDENSGLIFTFPKDTSAEAFGKSLIVSVKCDLTAPTGSGTKFTVQDITDEAINIIGSSSSGRIFPI